MGKLIVLEGTDGSGKSTQFARLTERLTREGRTFRRLVFPQYQEESSALIRMYLKGEFGHKPEDVNAYAASTFYAVDRYASYQKTWREDYAAGGLMMADRYTTSNMVHQGAKVSVAERAAFFHWLEELEFKHLGLPRPDLVIYLDVSTAVSETMMRKREQDTNTHADIHEQDLEYLRTCRAAGRQAAEQYGWKIIRCENDGAMRSIDDIHEEIYALVRSCLEE